MVRGERWFSLCMFAITAVFFIISFQYKMFSPVSGVGAAFLPRIITFILLLLVGFYVWKVFRDRPMDKDETSSNKQVITRQFIFALMLIVSLVLIEVLGMLITLGLFLVGSLHFIEKHSWFKSIMFGAVTILCLFFIFVKWLNVVLPSGLFF